jgi:hypothetical protein
LFHALGFELLVFLLDADHFLVLGGLHFETFCLAVVLFSLGHLLHTDSFFLILAHLLIPHLQLTLFLFSHRSHVLFVLLSLCVALTDPDNVICLLFGLFNFLPRLQNSEPWKPRTFSSSCFKRAIRLARSLTSSCALLRLTRWSASAPAISYYWPSSSKFWTS